MKILFSYINLPTYCTKYSFHLECPCLLGYRFRNRRSEYFEVINDFQKVEKEIVRYDILGIR